ncbi:MAG: S26 family signal peptidase [Planctomycetota bacterium]
MLPKARNAGVDRAAVILRLTRYGVYITVGVMIWWMLSNYTFVQLNEDDTSIVGISGYRRLLVERSQADHAPFSSGSVLVFAMLDISLQPFFRVSRVAAGPGDDVAVSNGFYTVNGSVLDTKVADRAALTGKVPDGFYLVFNDNPLSRYPDSRQLGLIDPKWVIGRFLCEMPF